MKRFLGQMLFSATLLAFGSKPAHAIELTIFNNINEHEDGSVIEIEEAESAEAPKNKVQFKVLPGDKKEITSGNVTTFIMSIAYPKHKIKYQVSCPKDAKGAKTITPVDVHNEELPGGCKVLRRGHWSKRTGMSWKAEGT